MPMLRPSRTLGAFVMCVLASCTAEPPADVGEFTTEGGDSSAVDDTGGTSSGATAPAPTTAPADDGVDGSSTDDDTGNPPVLDVASDDTGGPLGCNPAAQDFVFLLDMDSELHRFDPDSLELESLGTLACPGGEGGAMALTIDRDGVLWAMMVDQEGYRKIFTVDPDTIACSPTDFDDPFEEGYTPFSLAFVADGVDAETETLYINVLVTEPGQGFGPDAPSGLMRIPDLSTMATELVGELPIANTPGTEIADLTGTGEARMFALFASMPATVAEVDPATGDFISEDTLEFSTGSAWGFAQWAGRLWMFTGSAPSGMSEVRAVDLDTGDVELVSEDLGIRVVGAAVSTCAPYEPEG